MRIFNLYVGNNWTLCEMYGGVPVSGVASEAGQTTFMENVAMLDGAQVPYGSCRLNARGLINMADRWPDAVLTFDKGVVLEKCNEDLEASPLFELYMDGCDAS